MKSTSTTRLVQAAFAVALLAAVPVAADTVLSHAAKAAAREKTASGHFSSLGESNIKESLILAAQKWWGHDYMHQRYYSNQLARFVSVDPVLGDTSSSQSWNRYSYALNNPVNLVDPDGRAPHPGTLIGGAIGFGAGLITASIQETYRIAVKGEQRSFADIASSGKSGRSDSGNSGRLPEGGIE